MSIITVKEVWEFILSAILYVVFIVPSMFLIYLILSYPMQAIAFTIIFSFLVRTK